MEHQIGHFELVRWQGSKSRRLKPRYGFWTFLLTLFGFVGAGAMLAQSLGWLHLAGASSLAPGVLVATAALGPAVILLRAGLIWLAG